MKKGEPLERAVLFFVESQIIFQKSIYIYFEIL